MGAFAVIVLVLNGCIDIDCDFEDDNPCKPGLTIPCRKSIYTCAGLRYTTAVKGFAWLIMFFVVLGLAGCASRPAETDLAFRMVAKGHSCGITHRRFEVIRDSAAWTNYCSDMRGSQTNRLVVPPIDFSREEIVAVNLGLQPKADHDIEIIKVVKSSLTIRVLYTRWPLISHGLRAETNTTPYHVVAIPRNRMPARFSEVRPGKARKPFF